MQIVLGFVSLILLGTFLISLPVSNTNGKWLNFVDSFFTSTSAVCVTGLSTVDASTKFTLFGQIVVISLIQIGGLGVIALTSLVFLLLRKKLSLQNRMALQQDINKDTMQDIIKFIKKTILITFIVEGIGALLLLYSTITYSGSFWKGLFYAVFMSISSFCNAGFDILGTEATKFTSLSAFATDVTMLLPIMFLIIIGGIGFVVLIDGFKNFKNKQHTKIVLLMTSVLLFVGAAEFLICEWNNPNTIGNMSFGHKVLNAFFQSTSSRTAGIATLNQSDLTPMSRLTTMILMFIGGSPNSMAGGIKTTTLFLILLFIFKVPNSKGYIHFKGKQIDQKLIMKSLRVFMLSTLAILATIIFVRIFEPNSISTESIIFESISAFSTAGLSMGITPELTNYSKILLSALMFIGRVGITTILMAISSRSLNLVNESIEYPASDIVI